MGRNKTVNSELMKAVKNEAYTYLGIVELDKIKENKMKEKKQGNEELDWSRIKTNWEKQNLL